MPDEIEVFRWWLPPDAWNKKYHLSNWKMSLADAASRGFTEPDLSSREVRQGVSAGPGMAASIVAAGGGKGWGSKC